MSGQKDPITLTLGGAVYGLPCPSPSADGLCPPPPILKSAFPVPDKLPNLSALACAIPLPRMPFQLPSCPRDKLFVLPVTFSLWLL